MPIQFAPFPDSESDIGKVFRDSLANLSYNMHRSGHKTELFTFYPYRRTLQLQAQLMAEKATDALKSSLSGSSSGPTAEEILKSAGSVICLIPTDLFKKAVNEVQDKPVLLKRLMSNYTAYCGDRDPSRVSVHRYP